MQQIRRSAQAPVSLDKPVGDEDGKGLGHFVEDETALPPDEVAHTSLRNEALARVLETLGERGRRVLELRFGLNGERPHTLEEVARTFGLTRERIRQIENSSLRKLGALPESQWLRALDQVRPAA